MGILKRFPLNAVWVLAVQFIVGMYIALYVEFPENASVQAAWDFARGNGWILLHIALGLIILAGSIQYVVVAFMKKQKQLYGYGIVGLVSVLVALGGGEGFMSTQDDAYSMLMAVGFILAIVTYALAIRIPVTIKK